MSLLPIGRRGDPRGEGGPPRRLVGALAAIGAGTVGWAVHRLTAPEPTDIFPETLSPTERPLDSEQRARTLAMNLDAPYVEGNRVELLENGDRIFPAMLEAIDGAERSVNFLTYIYWTGEIARDFAAALARAARRGVQVRVLLDAYGAARMDGELVDVLEAAGCRVTKFHNVRWYTLRRFNNRTHRKVLVVDGELGFTGGVGIAEEWMGDAEGPGRWRDDHFRVRGPAVRYLQGAFAENWREEVGEALAGDEMFPALEPTGTATVVPVLGHPGGSISRVGFTYWLSLKTAVRRVQLVTPYFSPDRDLHALLLETARRGVEVSILVPSERIDKPILRWVARSHYAELLEAGCRIHEFGPAMMHTKVMVVDDDWAVVGSSNFDNRSFDLNYEVALAVVDRELATALRRSTERDLGRSREVTPEEVRSWTALERGRDRLAASLREQL